MKKTKLIMGMPIIIEIVDKATKKDLQDVFLFFKQVDSTFSTYKKDSEISLFNRGKKNKKELSADVKEIFSLSEKTKQETNGYFNIYRNGYCDPSGLVKGWAIQKAYQILKDRGFKNFYIDAGGDIQVSGKNKKGENWYVGIRNPFNREEIVKVVALKKEGIATSGTYIRGQHIYNPHSDTKMEEIVSLTVIGPDIYNADRFATAAYAMQEDGIFFIEKLPGYEAYMIDKQGIATYTSGFSEYVIT